MILALYSQPHASACGLEEHQEIIDALVTGNKAKAISAMEHHLDGIAERALAHKEPRLQKGRLEAILAPYLKKMAAGNTVPRARGLR